jgi:hypothetical protein
MSSATPSLDPTPNPASEGVAQAFWRLARGVWLATWRIYRGTLDWSRFPKSMLFGVSMSLLLIAMYVLDGLICNFDTPDMMRGSAILTTNLLEIVIGSLLNHKLRRWLNAYSSVLAVGALFLVPLDVIGHYAAFSPVWGEVGQLCGMLTTAINVWIVWTVARLMVAKVAVLLNWQQPSR